MVWNLTNMMQVSKNTDLSNKRFPAIIGLYFSLKSGFHKMFLLIIDLLGQNYLKNIKVFKESISAWDHLESLFTNVPKILASGRLKDKVLGFNS